MTIAGASLANKSLVSYPSTSAAMRTSRRNSIMATIRKAIEDNDPKKEMFDSVKTSLDLLDKLATLKLGELDDKIREQLADKAKFKVTHQDRSATGTHVAATNDANNISDNLAGIIKDFCAGSSDGTQAAVKGIVGTAVTALLGAAAGEEIYQKSYAAIAEDEILKRVDVAYWSYGIAAKGITEQSQCAIAYVTIKSYIDVTDVHSTELVAMYREAARLAGNPDDEKSILKALEEAQQILKAMKDDPIRATNNHEKAMARRLAAV